VVRLEVIESGELDLIPKATLKKALRKLKERPLAGAPLGDELKGCRSLKPGENRIVYRTYKQGNETICEVLAIDRRRESKAYKTAGKRV
jgi:mRNA-degrading endonuclease RelE of RelBE toxin-antitoxin system